MKKILLIAVAGLALSLWLNWQGREIRHPPGVLVPESPRQQNLQGGEPLELDGFLLTRRAAFDLRARVLSRRDYRWGDDAGLAPVDLALGWGPMSDQAVLDRVEISQSGRWYFTRYEHPAPISDQAIINHSGNMHMIPASRGVEKHLKSIRKGDLIRARGFLVDVDREDGFQWRSSLSREDTGNGSCELFYLEQIQIEPRN